MRKINYFARAFELINVDDVVVLLIVKALRLTREFSISIFQTHSENDSTPYRACRYLLFPLKGIFSALNSQLIN